jgi:hypothetical protein
LIGDVTVWEGKEEVSVPSAQVRRKKGKLRSAAADARAGMLNRKSLKRQSLQGLKPEIVNGVE